MDQKIKYLHDEIKHLKNFIEELEKDILRAKKAISIIHEHYLDPYKDMPGIEGIFDGTYLVTVDNQKYEVPPNYAAKTRILYGDRIKLIEENGKQLFKSISKQERIEVEAVIAKKDGKWFALTADRSYRISDNAAEFNKLNINDTVVVLVPKDRVNVPFAAFDKVLNPSQSEKKQESSKDPSNKEKSARRSTSTPKDIQDPTEKKSEKVNLQKKDNIESKEVINYSDAVDNQISSILEDDDLR